MSAGDARAVVSAFADAFHGRKAVREAFEGWVSPCYVQYNPLVPDGREAAIGALEQYVTASPGLSLDVERIMVDGDLTAVHSYARLTTDDQGLAIVDLYRVEGGLIVEHWDVFQPACAIGTSSDAMSRRLVSPAPCEASS